MPDNSARIHIASSDLAFPAKRDTAVRMICAAISDIATPFGYSQNGMSQNGTNWARGTTAGRAVINLHRNRFGWDCDVNLRFLTPHGTLPDGGIWQHDDEVRIQRFYPAAKDDAIDTTAFAYLDLLENPACLTFAMQILRDHALPWLDAHHNGLPDIAAYLPKSAQTFND